MKKRKILSLLLSLCLLIGLLPTAALAADQTNDGAGIRIVQGDAYDSNTGIFSIKVQAKLPVGTGISSVGTLLSYDNTKLAVVNKNNTSKDVTSNEGVKKESEAIISKTLIQTVDDDENTKEYTLQDSAMYKAGDRSGIYTFHYNGKPLTQKATDAQTGGKWFDVYEVMFRVTGKPADPATVLNSDSLRIADVAKGDDAVMKGAFPANDIYSIYLTDNSDPAKLYVLNRMSGCTATEVTGEKSLMTAPDTGTATYPGSTNSPSATTYTVTVQNDGNGTASASPATAAAGTEITLSATANSGYHFKEWQVVSGTVSIAGNKFTMPSSDVTVKAIFEADAPTTYTVTVQNDGNGTASASPATAAAGTEITLSATANSGYHFKEWQVVSGTVSIAGNKFTMPSSDVTVKAIFEADAPTTYTVTVQNDGNGTASASPATAAAGTEITLSATANSGYHFKEWQVVSGTVSIAGNKFTMPSSDVTVKAIFEADAPTTYTVTVQNDGNGTASASPATAAAGTEITLSATANSGYHFKEWQVVSGTVSIAGNKFTMPSSDVTVKAIFEADAPTTYTVTVQNDGNGTASASPATAAAGTEITLSATANSGYHFKEWQVVSGTVSIAGNKFTMPSSDVTVKAIFEADAPTTYTVTVQNDGNGTASASPATAAAGTEITLSATANSGYHFKEWQVVSGTVTIAGNKFNMPSSNVTVKAIFEADAPTTYTVTVQNDGNGTASASPATAAAGTEITLSATANSGYHFKEWQVVSGTVSIAGNKFNMPSSNVTVKAIFEADAPTTYTVTVQNDGNGTASASPATAAAGTEITLSATANSGYHFKEWQVVSGTVTIAGNKFNMPSSNVTVKAIFEADATTTYTVTFEANGGTASETSKQTGADGKLASLPTASRSRYSFDGWYTAASGGTQITTAYVFSANTTVYAHWTYTGGSSSGVVSAPTYPITVDKSVNGSVSVSNGSAVKDASVTITVKPDKGYTLETLTVLDKNGYALELTEKNGRFTFKMPASAVIVKATFMDDNTMLNLFVDVKASDYFYDAVLWAAEKGVTSGTDALHFSPNAPCTRAQIVTFLWRAAGSPAPKNMSSFADVPADAFYAKAVAWAVENGITGGTGDGKFSPDATCTRAQAVTFLYRASGAPAVSGNAAFSDVATNAYYAAAVKWAEKNGITGGIGGGLFGSNNNCTRAQIVTFLYRSVK